MDICKSNIPPLQTLMCNRCTPMQTNILLGLVLLLYKGGKFSHTLDFLLHNGPTSAAAVMLCFVYLRFPVPCAQLSEIGRRRDVSLRSYFSTWWCEVNWQLILLSSTSCRTPSLHSVLMPWNLMPCFLYSSLTDRFQFPIILAATFRATIVPKSDNSDTKWKYDNPTCDL